MKALELRIGGSLRTEIQVASAILDSAGSLIARRLAVRCAIIADENVARLAGERLIATLDAQKLCSVLLTIAPGEKSKSLEQVARICDEMIAAGLDRSSFVIGLGGGVVGDISGFVAAIFHRGIPHVQIPTTLLAMVDSSIGGKTCVNTSAGKNLIGAIHHPLLVIADVELLKTLPPREFRQGFAEIVKHAIIADADMFDNVAQLSKLRLSQAASWKLAPQQLLALVRRNIEIKAAIVAEDDHDVSGERALLNFGHTIGHAIERAGNYGDILHGEAISLGIVAASRISSRRAGLSKEEQAQIVAVLETCGLPVKLPANFPREKVLEALRYDKKFQGGNIRYVVTPKLGSAYVSGEVTFEDIRAAVEEL